MKSIFSFFHLLYLFFYPNVKSVNLLVLAKTRNDLKWPETIYSEQETTWSDLQRPTTSKKQPKTTCNEQEMTRNDLKRPSTSKKRPETICSDLKRPIGNKKRPWNDLQRARNDPKRPTTSKTQPTITQTYLQWAKIRCETTNNNQIFRLFYNMEQSVLFSNTFSTQQLVAIIRALLHGESWWK